MRVTYRCHLVLHPERILIPCGHELLTTQFSSLSSISLIPSWRTTLIEREVAEPHVGMFKRRGCHHAHTSVRRHAGRIAKNRSPPSSTNRQGAGRSRNTTQEACRRRPPPTSREWEVLREQVGGRRTVSTWSFVPEKRTPVHLCSPFNGEHSLRPLICCKFVVNLKPSTDFF
jgi:hypothetical protein